jgi:hypothetical protein
MSTVSSVSNPYVISHPVTDSNPGQTALNKGIERNNYQHSLVNVSKSGGASSKSKMKKNKKMRKSKRMSKMSSRRRFSRKFRKSLRQSSRSRKSFLGRRRNKNKNKMFSRGGAAAATMTIPSFSQTTPNGTSIINQLSVAHSQGLAYSAFDGDVKLPAAAASAAAAPSASVSK